MRYVDLAVYADALAGEAATLAARAERARTRLRESELERAARAALPTDVVQTLVHAELLDRVDARAARAELREVEQVIAALEALQAWVEERLEAEAAA